MNQIQPHALWIGTIGDLKDLRRLYDLGWNIHPALFAQLQNLS